ncbi:MAG: hypothetical protein Q4D57_03545 [Clostridia bacterium]|nr:hypothetical protein [Clostridia bacterium]
MKSNLKRFLCAAMVAVSSIFVGTVANAQPTQATVKIIADEEHPFRPEVGNGYILSVCGNDVNVTITDVDSRDVSESGNSDVFFASEQERFRMGRREGSVIRLRPNRIRTEYTITLRYDDAYAPGFMSHDDSVRYSAGCCAERDSRGLSIAAACRIHGYIEAKLIGNGQSAKGQYYYHQ